MCEDGIHAGLALFDVVSLTFRKAYAVLFGRPSNFSWFIEGSVAASGFPGSRKALEWVKRQGIDSILSLTPERIDEAYARQLGLTVARIPLANLRPASPEELAEAVNRLQAEAAEKKVLVHCLAGVGRTGMVLAAYLVKTKKMSAEEAIAQVRRLRPGSVQRKRQESAVAEYASRLS
jgi:atypical dual specificity phosphatase